MKEKQIYRWMSGHPDKVFEYILADSKKDAWEISNTMRDKKLKRRDEEMELIATVNCPKDVYNFIKTYNIYDDKYLRDDIVLRIFGEKHMMDFSNILKVKEAIDNLESTPIGEYDFG